MLGRLSQVSVIVLAVVLTGGGGTAATSPSGSPESL